MTNTTIYPPALPGQTGGGGEGGEAVWGSIGGTLNDQADLRGRLFSIDQSILGATNQAEQALTNSEAAADTATSAGQAASNAATKADTAKTTADNAATAAGNAATAAAAALPKVYVANDTNAATGTRAATSSDITVAPTADSTSVVFARRDQINWNSTKNLNTGGWITGHQSVANIGGSGTVGKVVLNIAQANAAINGTVSVILGYEPEVASIAAGSTISSFCGFYFPNLRNVPRINQIQQIAAFANDDIEAICRTLGPFYNGTLQEFAPAYHIGLIPDRYYSSPHRYVGAAGSIVGIAHLVPVIIPHRTTVKKVGMYTQTASAGAKCLFAIYTAENGRVQNRVWQSGEVDCSAVGEHEAAVNVRLDAGTYWIGAAFNQGFQIAYHSPSSIDNRVAMFGSSAGNSSDGATSRAASITFPYTPGGFPLQAGVLPAFASQDNEPHLWFRI